MKFLRKGFALFAGLMLLSNVFLPSAVVFAEEGTTPAATEQVNQVTQAEETASVEENSTPEVSPEKVVSESSEALAPETPKAEEGSETPAEKVNQEAKEEQKAEPASELTASSEPKKTEPASESEEGRGETSTLAQQGGGDAGSSDGAVVTPEVKQSLEEKKEVSETLTGANPLVENTKEEVKSELASEEKKTEEVQKVETSTLEDPFDCVKNGGCTSFF